MAPEIAGLGFGPELELRAIGPLRPRPAGKGQPAGLLLRSDLRGPSRQLKAAATGDRWARFRTGGFSVRLGLAATTGENNVTRARLAAPGIAHQQNRPDCVNRGRVLG